MKQKPHSDHKNMTLSCLFFCALVGALTGLTAFFFKMAANQLSHLAQLCYQSAAQLPQLLPVIFLALAVFALFATKLLQWCPTVKGGGIPTAVGILRGMLPFQWCKTFFATIFSSFLTFAAGVPLGSEGPCVQLGTAIGRGISCGGRVRHVWDRYLMTGGASAGFAAAAAAPMTGIFFALEEAHRTFSPMLVMIVFSSTIFSGITSQLLCYIFQCEYAFLPEITVATISSSDLWIAVVVGLAAAMASVLFSGLETGIYQYWSVRLERVPLYCKVLAVFLLTGIVSCLLPEVTGSGHALIAAVLTGRMLVSTLVILFLARMLLMLLANKTGITGGLFLPTLTLGAIVGALVAEGLLLIGVNPEYYTTIVAMGICAFLGATNRTPITALAFSVEALCCANNLICVGLCIFVAYLVMELLKIEPLTEIVLHARWKDYIHGKARVIAAAEVVVQAGSFVVGKSIRDVLWPANFRITRIRHAGATTVLMNVDSEKALRAGDVLTINFVTYCMDDVLSELRRLLGEQEIRPVIQSP